MRNPEKRPNAADCLKDPWFSEFFPNELTMTTNGSKKISQIENKKRRLTRMKSNLEANMGSLFEGAHVREPLKALHAGIHQVHGSLHHKNTQ